jgi:methylenetetrahydrofolate reductase (NADPH)
MAYGPCGGVRPDGSCEMRPGPCAFPSVVPWAEDAVSAAPLANPPLVLSDFSAAPFDPAGLKAVAQALAPGCDAVLVGEHHNRPDFPPTLLAQQLLAAGVRPVITLACRDRNRIVLEQELRGLQLLGVDAVLCVTGDGRGYDVRPDVTQVFDLDSMRLARLAAGLGVPAVVAESPTAPPIAQRAQRLVEKQRAGASAAILNHARHPDEVAAFMAAAADAGLDIPVLAAVAVFTDPVSAAVLQGLPGLELDAHRVARVLGARDSVAAGIDASVDEARRLLDIDGVVGVNLSGSASAAGYVRAAQIKAEVGRRVRAEAAAA